MIFNIEKETLPREDIEALQLRRLQNLCARVYANVPFYRKRFDESGIPVAEREGPGIGSRSIQAFVRKYGAYHADQTKDGWFTLTIAL